MFRFNTRMRSEQIDESDVSVCHVVFFVVSVSERQMGIDGIDPAVVSEILNSGPKEAGAGYSPHPGQCVCVPVYLCDNGQIITDGAGIIDIRQKPRRNGTLPSCENETN